MLKIPILSTGTEPTPAYISALRLAIDSDGCTKVPDWGTGHCCAGHDLIYKFGIDIYGNPCNKGCGDAYLKQCIEHHSRLHRWSVLARVFWLGVKGLGAWAYAQDVDARPAFETYVWQELVPNNNP